MKIRYDNRFLVVVSDRSDSTELRRFVLDLIPDGNTRQEMNSKHMRTDFMLCTALGAKEDIGHLFVEIISLIKMKPVSAQDQLAVVKLEVVAKENRLSFQLL